MIESAVVLTPLHYAYLIGVIVILAVMVLKKDTPAVCIAFLFILGLIGLKSVTGGIITVFSAVLYAGREFMEVLATIALVTSLSKCLKDLGSDYLMMVPMAGIMKTPSLTWWILGLTMFLFSLFLWPSPSVCLLYTSPHPGIAQSLQYTTHYTPDSPRKNSRNPPSPQT